jgi:3-hydroxyisobutyrate dehydrogenase-like beta-hydroxyacid dehydrogenase
MDIGVVGLGGMGSGIAASLLRAGHRVRVWNRSPDKAKPLVDQGAAAVAHAAEAFAGDAVITMLADDRAVRETVLDAGLIEDAPETLIHLSCSTLSMDLAIELEQRHARAGLGYVSSPVFGRPSVAEQGQLNVLAAGDPAVIARVRPVLDAFAKQVWPLGEAAHKANLVKLAVNMSLANAIEAMGEAFTLARRWDVDPAKLAELMTGTLFDAPAYKIYAPLILEEAFEPAGFKLALGLKDVRLALQAGEAKAVPLPFAGVVRDNFLDAIAHGDADKDWAALGAVAARRAGY